MPKKAYIKKTYVEKLTRKLNNLLSLPPINRDNYKSEYDYRKYLKFRESKIKQLQRELGLAQREEKAEK